MLQLERVQLVGRSLPEVFDFFADAHNLEAITPPFLSFRILTPGPIQLATGALIDYRLRLFGVPFTWRTRIESFDPLRRFVDAQVRGPYAHWRHLHEFYETSDGTLVVDRVEYRIGWSLLGRAAHATFVRSTLDGIFDYRRARIYELLDRSASSKARVAS